MNKLEAIELFTEIIQNSYDSKKEVPHDKSPSDVSKIIFEQLVDSEVMNLKIFFYSSGRNENNKPYTYAEKIGREDLNAVLDARVFLLESKKSEGLLSKVRSKTSVDTEAPKEVIESDINSVAKVEDENAEDKEARIIQEELDKCWDESCVEADAERDADIFTYRHIKTNYKLK